MKNDNSTGAGQIKRTIAPRPKDVKGEPMLTPAEMAQQLGTEPGWLTVQIEAGLIPVVYLSGQPWFRPRIVRRAVEAWQNEPWPMIDMGDTPMPKVRYCSEASSSTPGKEV